MMDNPVYEHFDRHYGWGRQIYVLTLVGLTAVFIALFFIRVPVSVQALGMLIASQERMILRAPESGIVKEINLEEHAKVKRGDVLLTLDQGIVERRDAWVTFKKKELSQEIQDLTRLHSLGDSLLSSANRVTVYSVKYRGQWDYFRQQIREAETEVSRARQEFTRFEKLYQQRMIADAEFEKYRYALNSAVEKRASLIERQQSAWQGELQSARSEREEYATQNLEHAEEKKRYTLLAPDDGTIQQVKGVKSESVVIQGDVLAELSPESTIVVRVYVSPKDIGLIRIGMDVLLRVDAFDYTQWGFAHATVHSIAPDVVLQENVPMFEVRCSLRESELTLPNGYRGKLKKGMTAQASFRITERTLFQLLYEKADDWLNPQRL